MIEIESRIAQHFALLEEMVKPWRQAAADLDAMKVGISGGIGSSEYVKSIAAKQAKIADAISANLSPIVSQSALCRISEMQEQMKLLAMDISGLQGKLTIRLPLLSDCD